MLRFLVEETLAGRDGELKQYVIAVEAYGRSASFDPDQDPIVRVQAGRLRRALDRYYRTHGRDAEIRISIPKGRYVPSFEVGNAAMEGDATAALPPSIAVLPVRNATGDASLDYFCTGFCEELSSAITCFPVLRVITAVLEATHDVSSDAYLSRADYLITGTLLMWSNRRLRVSVALRESSRGEQLWARRFERVIEPQGPELADIIHEIVASVISATVDENGVVSREVARRVRERPVAQLETYEALFRSHQYAYTVSLDDYDIARAALEHAVQTDPGLAPGWAALAQIYLDSEAFGYRSIDDALDRGCACSRRAILLDPGSQLAQYSVAYASLVQGNLRGVIHAADSMLEINDYAAHIVGSSGWFLCMVGEFEGGLARIDRSRVLNPNGALWFEHARFLHAYMSGKYQQALEAAQSFEVPGMFWSPLSQAVCLAKLGREAEAQRAHQELLETCPDFAETARYRIGLLVKPVAVVDALIEGVTTASPRAASA